MSHWCSLGLHFFSKWVYKVRSWCSYFTPKYNQNFSRFTYEMIPRALIIFWSLEVLVFVKRNMFSNNRTIFLSTLESWTLLDLWLQRKSEFKRSFNTSISRLTVFIKRLVQLLFAFAVKYSFWFQVKSWKSSTRAPVGWFPLHA